VAPPTNPLCASSDPDAKREEAVNPLPPRDAEFAANPLLKEL
jgi:hypothetical protein